MTIRQGSGILAVLFFAALFFVAISIPQNANAQPGAANAMCIGLPCPCGKGPGKGPCDGTGNGKLGCYCAETVNGKLISGKCGAVGKCEGTTGEGLGGAGEALGMLKSIMDLLKGKGGGGGGGEPPPTDPKAEDKGCTTYYPTTVPSSDPCAIYSPSGVLDAAASGNAGVSSSLLDALNGGSNTGSTNKTTPAPTTGTSGETKTGTNVTAAAPGLSGDVRIGSAGATIIANLRQGLSEVAGFFGGSTGGASQALSAAGKLCSTRPWAGTFVGNVIPSSFFDGLCEWRGYQAGVVTPTNAAKASNASATQKASASRPGISLQPAASDVPPEVDIWAEPSSVRLGTRTYIFWNARGVVSCKGSGPSFSQNSLSGGASTVPITGPTTFNIECLTTASSTVKDSVTVQIAI